MSRAVLPRLTLVGILLVAMSADGFAEEAPWAADLDARVETLIGRGEIPGATVAVARHGKVAYLKSFGTFADDSIVRIYSMTKPVTVVAALMLVDEGKLSLEDPVSKFLPGFEGLRVEGGDEPPTPITIRHLMQHTAGLTYGLFGNSPVDRRYRSEDVLSRDHTLEVMAAKLAGIPLLYTPGTRWHYSVSIDVLGRVIEVASEQPFDAFLETRLFQPLGMVDTGFHVPDEKLGRFVPCCSVRSRVMEAVDTSPFRTVPKLLSGGGGLVSTVHDFLRFALMLDAGGTWEGTRILKPETAKLMTTNQLPEELVPIRFGILPLAGMGFGLGVSVRVEAAGAGTRVGTWGWAGAASTTFFVSPEDRLVVITLVQRMPLWTGLDRAVRSIVFGALEPTASAGAR